MKLIKTIGVIGAGTMGAALAQKFAQEDFSVILVDREMHFIERGLKNIRDMLMEGVERRVFSKDQVTRYMANITGTTDLAALRSCDLVIEAIFENFQAKTALFQSLDHVVSAETIIATNTSSFSVTELAQAISHPERFIGLHYFYHAAKNRLVEIIPGRYTSPEVFDLIRFFCMQSGKDAITCRDSYGFVVNRYFVPWLNEAVRILEEQLANIATIDDVSKQVFGIGMGPFELMNATGIPVAYHAQKTLEVFGPFYKVSEYLGQQVASQQHWNLEGFISTDDHLRKMIGDRLLGVVFLVCNQLLDEKVCTATAINRGARIGLQWKKGPVDMMLQTGDNTVHQLISQVAERYDIPIPNSSGKIAWHMEYVDLEKRNHIAVLTINRPEDLNALNETMVTQLDRVFDLAESDPTIKTIFIIGSGKAFVAGADIRFFIKNIKAQKIGDIESFTAYGQRVFAKIDDSSKKVVAIINGLALGGGLELALCADVVLSLPKAQLAFPETGIGIYPGFGGTQRTVRKIGKGLTKYLVFTGNMLEALEAESIGLVDKVITFEEFYTFLNGASTVPVPDPPALNDTWQKRKRFFEKYDVNAVLDHVFDSALLGQEESEQLFKTLRQKAPIAIRLADMLITEQKGFQSELDHLVEIFSSEDAINGLSNIGRQVEYHGR